MSRSVKKGPYVEPKLLKRIEEFTDTKIEGSFIAENNEILYTSIPYDEGWNIYIDGKKANNENLIKISDAMKNARKIVIKIGSNTLAKADGTTNIEFMQGFAEQCKSLIDSGKQIVLVSSGAQVSGLATIHNWARKRDVHYRQALCAIGQVELMNQWRKAFAKQDLHIGQLLLTKEDFEDDHRTLNMRNTIFTLVDEGVIPIINENDSVSFDEIKMGRICK